MKIAIYQGPGIALDVAANIHTIGMQAERASRERARLLIAPEMILSGYNIGPAAIAERAEASDGPSAQAIAELARQHNIAILYGYPERENGNIYNAVQLIDRASVRVRYRPDIRDLRWRSPARAPWLHGPGLECGRDFTRVCGRSFECRP